MKKILTTLMTALVLTACSQQSLPQLATSPIDEVIAALTLEEKVRLLIGSGMEGYNEGESAVVGDTRRIIPGAAGTTYPVDRLGIPAIVLADGPAGLRINPTREDDNQTYYCTHFPIGTLLASTWNTELVESVGQAIGNEVREYGCDVLLAPALNIHRNPLCGRNFEYYSEDPVVSGKTAAAYVRGVQSQGVGTSVKHFAANNQETNRTANDVIVSARTLREIYLKGFEMAIKESAPWTVMSSYNYINGTYASESTELLTTLLRDEWGFDGMVMTDWFGGSDAPAQMVAGNDMLQPGYDKQYNAILQAVQSGALDEAIIDRNVARMLELVKRTPKFAGYNFSNHPDLEAHATITRQSAVEGMVLLKNDSLTLPLPADKKRVELDGCNSYDFIAGGTGSGTVNRAYTVSLTDGLKNAGYTLDNALQKVYEQYIVEENERNRLDVPTWQLGLYAQPRPAEYLPSASDLAEQAQQADVALITLGRISGEFFDRLSTDFNLSSREQTLIKTVCDAFHAQGKRVVVVLNIGGAIETASWKAQPDAILCAWQAGQEGGNSVVDVLSGKQSPSGKLTMTFPNSYKDALSTNNFPVDVRVDDKPIGNKGGLQHNIKNVDYTEYEEGIFVGYRDYDTNGKAVSYPFGYGLSYTTFAMDNLRVDNNGKQLRATIDITNTGSATGKEVVQLYIAAPDSKSLPRPAKELKAYAKTKALEPGEKQTLQLAVNIADLAAYDDNSSAWVTTEGEYTLLIGNSSRNILATETVNISNNN